MEKMTKREMFTAIAKEVAHNAEMVAFIEHEIELLNKKSENKKPTKRQTENASYIPKIVDIVATYADGATVAEIATNNAFEGFSNQRITALLRLAASEGLITKVEGKKALIYKVVTD